ncbi:hypothetical protein [Rahnella woolbedingensis]|uniref:Thymidylate kinase n=1 Tax=Rahnella woolbedingensis TaxID=1510574 RepID=A0A419NAW6_9GAMM|nr:hypothetical protein [Rahnella woolbedingensis]RJT45096.1 hypothetical protein D6C13_08385 [Rahnella woolbedingensis]
MQKETMKTKEHVTPEIIPGLIAVVGCDGTGKSTLTHDLVKILREHCPTERRYLGLISGEDGDKIKRLPFIGVWLERRLATKSSKTQSMSSKSPALWAALIMYGLSLRRESHLHKAKHLAESGVFVISDRYPQAQISGFHYDGPGIGIERVSGWVMTKLAESEYRLYKQMELLCPELIIRLDIDIATAIARKPDHSYPELKDKIGIMTQLNYNGSRIIDLDARAPYDEVLKKALEAVVPLVSHFASREEVLL